MRTATLVALAVVAAVASLAGAELHADVPANPDVVNVQPLTVVDMTQPQQPHLRPKRGLLLAKGLLVGGALGAGALGAGALGLGAVGLGAGVVGAGALGLGAGLLKGKAIGYGLGRSYHGGYYGGWGGDYGYYAPTVYYAPSYSSYGSYGYGGYGYYGY